MHQQITEINQNKNIKLLILLENEEQVRDCLNWLNEVKNQKQIIALSPFAMYELDRQNIPYSIPEDYYDSKEVFKLGIENRQKLEKICETTDKRIHEVCPVLEKLGIKPALFNIYYLKIPYDGLTVRLFQLSRVILAEKPDYIIIYASSNYNLGICDEAPDLFFNNKDSIYAHLLALQGWKTNIVFLPYTTAGSFLKNEKCSQSWKEFKGKIAGKLLNSSAFYTLASNIKKNGLIFELKNFRKSKEYNSVLLFGGGYNWDDSMQELFSVGIKIQRIRDDRKHWLSEPFTQEIGITKLSKTWENLQGDGEFHKFFVMENVDFYAILKERLQFLVERLTLACMKAYMETIYVIKRKDIKAVLFSSLSTCTGHSAAQAANNVGLPVVNWQHGNYGYINSLIVEYNDIMTPDVHLVYGEGVARHYVDSAKRFGTQLKPIGSASLDKVNRVNTKNENFIIKKIAKRTVLYVTTNYMQNNLYVSYSPPFSDNYLWITQRAIIDVLGKFNKYNVIVKLHPNDLYREPPLGLYVKEKRFENCQIVRDEYTLVELLPSADITIIDSPSTTLLQALTTKKPIFAFTGLLHINKDAEELLRHRAFCYRDLQAFCSAIQEFLENGSIKESVDYDNTEFLKMFGTHLNDGKSGIRAAAALKDIILSWNKVGGSNTYQASEEYS